jgi:hypothetical protein
VPIERHEGLQKRVIISVCLVGCCGGGFLSPAVKVFNDDCGKLRVGSVLLQYPGLYTNENGVPNFVSNVHGRTKCVRVS